MMKIMKYVIIVFMIVFSISPARSSEFLSWGQIFYSMSLFKSSNIGSFEPYLAPEFSKFSRFNLNFDEANDNDIALVPVTADRNFNPMNEIFTVNNLPFQNSKSLLFPDAGYHNKINYKIALNPGYVVSINQDFFLNSTVYNNVHRIGLSCFYDVNKVKLLFPNGVGILTDPTNASGKNIFNGCGPHIGVAVNKFKIFSKNENIFIKYHLIHYNTESSAKIFSSFLNLKETKFQKKNASMFSVDYILPIFKNNDINLVFSTYAFQSKYMWTVATSLGIEKKY